MNYLLEGLLKWPARRRHASGYGLHSPYAFAMVTGVLRDTSCGYYAYSTLGETARRWHRSEREARSLYRLLVHLRSVLGDNFNARCLLPASDDFLLDIARIALPQEAFENSLKPSNIILADRFKGTPADAEKAIRMALSERPSACLITGINSTKEGRALRRFLLDEHSGMMVFDGWHSMLLVARDRLPAQCFPVLFPR